MHKVIYLLLIGCFFLGKGFPNLNLESFLSASGTLPQSLQGKNLGSHVLQTFFNFEPISLSLIVLTMHLTSRLLRSNEMPFEFPTLLIGSTLLHGGVGQYLAIPTIGTISITAACVGFSLIHSTQIHSLRDSRNAILAGVAALIMSPHTSLISVLCGLAVGAFVSIITNREKKLCHLSLFPHNNHAQIADIEKRSTVEELLKRYTRRSA